jgi:glyoxylase-like metal-dependent hydrolase (beta-lactamase superfamily II)
MKKILIIVGASVLVVLLGVVAAFGIAFAGTSPIVDGQELPASARIVKDGIVSADVLPVGDGTFVLVDCGMVKTAEPIVAELKRRHAEPTAVKAIFLTHGHRDHAGGCSAFPNAEIFGLASERALLAGQAHRHSPLSRFFGSKDTGVRITRPLSDGETVRLGALTITDFAVPGHTDGSAAYLINGVLYLGDSADSSKTGTLMPAKWLFSLDKGQNRDSLIRLYRQLEPRSAEVGWLVFSHSGPLRTLAPLANFANAK